MKGGGSCFAFDNRTLTLVLIMIIALLVALMHYCRVSKNKAKGSQLWMLGNALLGLGFTMLYFQGYLPKFITYLVSNFALLCGFIVLSAGVYQFLDKKINIRLYGAAILVYWVSFIYYVYMNFHTSNRIVILSVLFGVVIGDIARVIYKSIPADHKGVYQFSAATFGIMALYQVYRGVSTMAMVYIPTLYSQNTSVSIAFIMMILGVISWTMGLTIMNSTKLEQELGSNLELLQNEIESRKMMEIRLKSINEKLEELTVRDSLTGLYNRRYMLNEFDRELLRVKRKYQVFSLAILDLDKFKLVNDTFGHNVGDEVLVAISEILDQSTREVDLVGRYGGEEFMLIFPNTKMHSAYRLLDRIRNQVEHIEWPYPDLITTFSGGIVEINSSNMHHLPKNLISQADEALYRAKEGGRNRIEIYNDVYS